MRREQTEVVRTVVKMNVEQLKDQKMMVGYNFQ